MQVNAVESVNSNALSHNVGIALGVIAFERDVPGNGQQCPSVTWI